MVGVAVAWVEVSDSGIALIFLGVLVVYSAVTIWINYRRGGRR